MFSKYSTSRKIFVICNYIILIFLAFICLLPIINILAVSLSSSSAAGSGLVRFWPVEFSLKSYEFVLKKKEFLQAFAVSVKRLIVGVPVNMILTILLGYPLAKENHEFRGRQFYVIFFVITMLFSGGLIPWYMTISNLKLVDNFWALILPNAVPVFNVIIMMNFFRQLPKELEEAALIDGATRLRTLFQILVPLAKPAIATLTLFCIITHWNSWFDGLLLMNTPDKYPLQSYLQTVIINQDMSLMTSSDVLLLSEVSDRTQKAAQAFVAAFPVLIVYPFLQKYFASGIIVGGVKG